MREPFKGPELLVSGRFGPALFQILHESIPALPLKESHSVLANSQYPRPKKGGLKY